ncbi:MAG: hypothetical protein ACJAVZ_001161 [Afipia broomeae]|jgi:hypothetical protein
MADAGDIADMNPSAAAIAMAGKIGLNNAETLTVRPAELWRISRAINSRLAAASAIAAT